MQRRQLQATLDKELRSTSLRLLELTRPPDGIEAKVAGKVMSSPCFCLPRCLPRFRLLSTDTFLRVLARSASRPCLTFTHPLFLWLPPHPTRLRCYFKGLSTQFREVFCYVSCFSWQAPSGDDQTPRYFRRLLQLHPSCWPPMEPLVSRCSWLRYAVTMILSSATSNWDHVRRH